MSDHGEALGDHGLIQKGCRFYDNAVRVPLILSWPGRFQAGLRSPALVELTDLAPTFLDAAGIEAPHWIQGRSLLPLLTGAAPSEHHRDFVRSEYYDAVDMPDNTHATMYRDDRYKLVVYHGHDLGELYDMQVDPDEHDNLWDVPDRQALKNESAAAQLRRNRVRGRSRRAPSWPDLTELRYDPDDFAAIYVTEDRGNLGRHRRDRPNTVVRRNDNDHAHSQPCEVLLVLDALVPRNEDIKPFRCMIKQLAVVQSRPSLAWNGRDRVPGEESRELSWYGLVKQNAHRRSRSALRPQ